MYFIDKTSDVNFLDCSSCSELDHTCQVCCHIEQTRTLWGSNMSVVVVVVVVVVDDDDDFYKAITYELAGSAEAVFSTTVVRSIRSRRLRSIFQLVQCSLERVLNFFSLVAPLFLSLSHTWRSSSTRCRRAPCPSCRHGSPPDPLCMNERADLPPNLFTNTSCIHLRYIFCFFHHTSSHTR